MKVIGEFFEFFEVHGEGVANFIMTMLSLSVVALVFSLSVKLAGGM